MYSFILLPHIFKKIGFVGAVTFYISEKILKYGFSDYRTLEIICMMSMLLSMLVVTISKEKVEDEMTAQIRAYSYSSAFFVGIAYTAIFQPLLVFLGSYFLDRPVTENHYLFVSLRLLLWFMFFQQIMMFWQLKKRQNEEG